MKFPRLFALVAFTLLAATLPAKPRDDLWAKLKTQQEQKLPQSAIATLNLILASAQADHAWPEVIRATVQKTALESDTPEKRIRQLTPIVEQAPPETKPLFEAILARWYWSYIQQNRWPLLHRTDTESAPGPDFQTWDLPRLMAEAERHFTAALAEPKKLQSISVAAYDGLLEPGTAPDATRPTLYDFLVNEALSFYESDARDLTNFEDGFTVAADGPAFAAAEDFIRWDPANPDTTSPTLQAIRLHRELLAFHSKDRDQTAYHDADLARLLYVHRIVTGDEDGRRYEAALERFIAASARYESSARAQAELAELLHARGDEVRARALALRGSQAFPDSVGGVRCDNIVHEIEAKSAWLMTETVWTAPWPTLDVTYRNVTRVYFRAVAVDMEHELRAKDTVLDNPKQMLARQPVLAWQSDLAPTRDYKQRTVSLPVPTTLKPGAYCILASNNPAFTGDQNQVSAKWVWVSDLALLTLQGDRETKNRGFVLQASTGEPVAGAKVQVWENRRDSFALVSTVKTDRNGQFAVRPAAGSIRDTIFLATHEGQSVSNFEPIWHQQHESHSPTGKDVVFLTDRAIYRPGQTIRYKGICIQADPGKAKYETVANLPVTVLFFDANQKEVARTTHRTNAFGSFSGTFTAPRGGLLGRMNLHTDGLIEGDVSFRVEEYKRPKFQVALIPAAEAPRLGSVTRVTVKATAYTGAAVGGALVKWQVERDAVAPAWCWWWTPGSARPITHGTAVTAPDGTVEISFPLEPDRSVPEKNEPVFTYSVHADLTDASGETRSADCSVNAGYTTLLAEVTADDWQTSSQPVACTISTRSLSGAPQTATGRLTWQSLRQPAAVRRGPPGERGYFYALPGGGAVEPEADPANPETWAADRVMAEQSFATGTDGKAGISTPLPAGLYRVSIRIKDRFGKAVTARRLVRVLDAQAAHCDIKTPFVVAAPTWEVEPGHTFTALWGTGYDTGRAYVEFECAGRILKSGWTTPGRTQELLSLPITKALRGGVTLRVTFVRENRVYGMSRTVDVPWSDRELDVKWETFRSKLVPGQAETWTALVRSPATKPLPAEMVATLYDASLDQFAPHAWSDLSWVFRQEASVAVWTMHNSADNFRRVAGDWSVTARQAEWRYREFVQFPGDVSDEGVTVLSAYEVTDEADAGYLRTRIPAAGKRGLNAIPMSISVMSADFVAKAKAYPITDILRYSSTRSPRPPVPDLDQVAARKNLGETAFFFPHLLTDENGRVKFQFTMPEALTTWKFLGFAHDANLRSGLLTAKVVTAKDLMVEPNPPRFVREGDVIEFTAKVTNRTDQPQSGKVRLTLADAATAQSADRELGNTAPEQAFTVPAKESRSFTWRLTVPDGAGFLTYKVVGASTSASDGEEGFLPVLSRRILVTESLPLSIRGAGTKQFEFTKLLDSGRSDSLHHQSLTVQMVSQPAWYAVMALPYLMEFPHECSEQVFNRLYANALARHLANSDPKIQRIFAQWRDTPALDSPLAKNQDLKSLMIEETPWLADANQESEARRNVGVLFDSNRLEAETARLLHQLTERQLADGLWSWFPGGPSSDYISLYLVAGFGRLQHLGVKLGATPALKALDALDTAMAQRYTALINHDPHAADYVPTAQDALYLYARSFFLADKPIARANRDALEFYLKHARLFWTKVGNRQSEAHLALALQRFGDTKTPAAIVRSLKERSVTSEEMGRFWRDESAGWWWYEAPIETQAMMIEVFDEVAHDEQAVEDCQVWLLKQKQTQNWPTTKATADAIYSLLLRGSDHLLTHDALVSVALGGETISPDQVEAGTGRYEKKFTAAEIKPAMGHITVKKTDSGVSWGGVHWQYLEDLRKITSHEGTPLSVKKSLWIKENTARGPVLKPVTGPVAVGDELVVRLELRTDREMEYVHLKDQRGSGTEPVNVLSEYKWQDGLGYYESTRDTATHFFIEHLSPGTYVFEYSTRVQLRGTYQSGIAEIQCMYAPEFNSHSESQTIEVK